ncbi:MAG: hypothetical protein IKM95_08520 [Bacteroidales bacterium]|nr:hypothetical protein [Bacteroidales bacterium]
MRHTAHIMLGADSVSILSGIKQYVIKYGDNDLNSYFKAFLFPKLDPQGDACFMKAELVNADESVFVAGIDEMYEVQLGDPYEVLSGNWDDFLKGFFRWLYDTSITINRPGDSSTMNICVYVPLYLKVYWSVTEMFLTAMDALPQSFHVDLFLLPYDTAFLFQKKEDNLTVRFSEFAKTSKEVLEAILKAKDQYRSLGTMVMLQNCNSGGVSLNLDDDSFVRIAGEYALLSVKHYPEMFQPAAQDNQRPIHALGLSVLSFDKYYFVQYLLHKAYTHILDRESVSQTEVEVNKVSQIVQGILSQNVNVFSQLYDREIAPRLNNNLDHAEIISQVSPALNKEIGRLTQEFQAYIDDPELSLPEKKATLAQLLGEDDDLLIGYMFNKHQLVIDDCCREVLDLFVNANNQLCKVRLEDEDEAEHLKGYAILSPTGESVRTASALLDDLKATKVSMRESTNYIRQKTTELEGLDVQRQDHKESFKRLTNDGFVFEGHTYKLQEEVEEIDLEEEYKPVTFLSPSVDLRESFTPVKDQGKMGACSSFALVGIFEFILKKNHQPDINLSEQFVYYNARKAEGASQTDTGSSLSDVLKTMKEQGVCLEQLFPYNPDNIALEPPVEAYDDAQNRKIVHAKNVKRSLQDIKSALYEGYPVAITLKIFDSFNPRKGFIRIPSEQEIQNEKSGYHTMVVCGYNDEARFFVVRNSWGRKFGEKGYCYIPYGYIENESLTCEACIITEINDIKLQVKGTDQKTVVSFDLTDSNIKSEILNNLIREEKLKLQRITKELQERSRLFNELFQQLGNNGNREAINDGTKERLEWECGNLTKKKDLLSGERLNALKNFDRQNRRYRWFFWGGVASVLLGFIIACIVAKSLEPFARKLSFGVYGIVALASVAFWLIMRYRKRKRKDLDLDYKDQLEQLAQEISKRQREKEITHLKTHLAGMIIDSLYKLGRNLHAKYNGMRSYVGNLKVWRDQERESMMTPPCKDPFLTLISNECLDKYFDENKDTLTEGLELSRMFRDRYDVREEEVVRFKYKLKKKLVTMLFGAIEDFSVFKYVTQSEDYPYVSRGFTDVDRLLRQMDYKSTPFVRLNPSVANAEGVNTYCKMMFLYAEQEQDRKVWENACSRNFSVTPQNHLTDSPYKITLLQLKGVSKEEITILN